GARTRSTWPAQDQFEVVDGHLGERRQILPIQREAEMRRVKRGGTAHVLDLIPYSPKAQDETFVLRSRGIFIGHVVCPLHLGSSCKSSRAYIPYASKTELPPLQPAAHDTHAGPTTYGGSPHPMRHLTRRVDVTQYVRMDI